MAQCGHNFLIHSIRRQAYSREGSMAIPEVSPVTGILEEDQVFVDFGEHEGKSILEISDTEPEFYQFLLEKRNLGESAIRRTKDKLFRFYLVQGGI